MAWEATMNLTQMRYFVRVCEAQSLSKAAAIIRIAQPALSRQVKALEQELGAQLLVRQPWGVAPTPAGEVLLDQARKVLKQVEVAREAVRATESEPSGPIAVGAPSSIATILFPPLLAALRRRHPRLRPMLIDEISGALHQRTLRGEVDIAILHADRMTGVFSQSPLLVESVGLAASPALAAKVEAPTPDEIATLPLLVSTALNRSRLTLEALLKGKALNLVAEVDCMPALLQMLADGAGFALLPFSAVHSWVERGALAYVDLGYPDLRRELEIVRAIDRPPSPSAKAVEALIRELVSGMQAKMRWTYRAPRRA
jgi:LysR family nitrogen assimilation transcriptional regulator